MIDIKESAEAVLNKLDKIDYYKRFDIVDELNPFPQIPDTFEPTILEEFANTFFVFMGNGLLIDTILHKNKINEELLKNYKELKSYELVTLMAKNTLLHILNKNIPEVETELKFAIEDSDTFLINELTKTLNIMRVARTMAKKLGFANNYIPYKNIILKDKEWIEKAKEFDEEAIHNSLSADIPF
jgi:hypothetical protein